VQRQFLTEPTGSDEPGVAAVPKKPFHYQVRLRQKLRSYVGVNNQTHSYTQEIPLFGEEELPESGRRIDDAAGLVQLDVMDLRSMLESLEVEKRNVLGIELFATDLHADAVYKEIAVGLDDEPPLLVSLPGEEASQLSLRPRMQVHLWLLKQKESKGRPSQ